jgi:hypothetical protein
MMLSFRLAAVAALALCVFAQDDTTQPNDVTVTSTELVATTTTTTAIVPSDARSNSTASTFPATTSSVDTTVASTSTADPRRCIQLSGSCGNCLAAGCAYSVISMCVTLMPALTLQSALWALVGLAKRTLRTHSLAHIEQKRSHTPRSVCTHERAATVVACGSHCIQTPRASPPSLLPSACVAIPSDVCVYVRTYVRAQHGFDPLHVSPPFLAVSVRSIPAACTPRAGHPPCARVNAGLLRATQTRPSKATPTTSGGRLGCSAPSSTTMGASRRQATGLKTTQAVMSKLTTRSGLLWRLSLRRLPSWLRCSCSCELSFCSLPFSSSFCSRTHAGTRARARTYTTAVFVMLKASSV